MQLSNRRLLTKLLASTALAIGILALSGCSTIIYKMVGRVAINLGEDIATPYMLSIDDIALACDSAKALNPLLLSFGRVTISPDELETLLGLVGGNCAAKKAFELDLDYSRYVQNGQVSLAKDARIMSKRMYGLAAKRFYGAYLAMTRAIGEPGEECPDYDDDLDELVWLLGSLSAALASMSDIQADMAAGVPLNLAPKIERGLACMDNDHYNNKWWGLPKGGRAVLWVIVPGIVPEGVDHCEQINIKKKMGDEQGVRVGYAMDAIAAYNANDFERIRTIIKAHAESLKTNPSSNDYRMVDAIAADLLLDLSDRMWTEETGSRTPFGGYGTFWDDSKESIEVDQDLLDELL